LVEPPLLLGNASLILEGNPDELPETQDNLIPVRVVLLQLTNLVAIYLSGRFSIENDCLLKTC
jgi:hypothetical protein